MRLLLMTLLCLLVAGCGSVPGGTSAFSDTFDSAAERWQPMGGTWTVIDGVYIGNGAPGARCSGFSNNAALIRGLEASDVDLRLEMRSLVRVDKGIILRSSGDSQIEINIRAERPGAFPADLVVQEVRDCFFWLHTREFEVRIPPHRVGDTVPVRVRLIGERLQIWIGDGQVLDRAFSFLARRGRVGVGSIQGGSVAFDNIRVEVLK